MNRKNGIRMTAVYLMALLFFISHVGVVHAEEEIELQDISIKGDYVQSEKYQEGDFSYYIYSKENFSYACIAEYTGNDKDVVIPETVAGGVPVMDLDDFLFRMNDVVETIFIPKYVYQMGDYGNQVFELTPSLREINVDPKNPEYFSRDGILFSYAFWDDSQHIYLQKYPEGREDKVYRLPDDILCIGPGAFEGCHNLEKIIVPETVSELQIESFLGLQNTVIVFQHPEKQDFSLKKKLCFSNLKNVTIVVKNEEIKQLLEEDRRIIYCTNTEVKTIAQLTAQEKEAYLTPAKSLTFSDGSMIKNVTLKEDEFSNIRNDLETGCNPRDDTLDEHTATPGSYQYIEYALSPADTTDGVTWKSSDPSVARAVSYNGEASLYGLKAGTCTITGCDESGHTLTLNVTVTSRKNEQNKQEEQKTPEQTTTEEKKPAAKAKQKISGTASVYKKSYKSNFTLKAKAKTPCSYKSSNKKVATVTGKGKVTVKGVGKVTITVTAKETAKYKKAVKKITIYAVPAKIKTTSVKGTHRKAVLSWKKDSKADGYYIQYSTNKKFKGSKRVYCSKKSAKKTIGKLKKGKKYYFRICACKKISGKIYCGSYSTVKSVKIK